MNPGQKTESAENICFITGGTGFIGKNLIYYLTHTGFQVRAIVRSPAKAEDIRAAGVTILQGDILDKESLELAMQGCSLVFHLAALTKPFSRNPDEFYRINVTGTRNVLEIALKNKVKKVVFTSTTSTFRHSAEGETVTEITEKPHSYDTDYARTKAEAEEVCREFVRKGLPVVIVNPSRVFGPGELTTGNSFTLVIRSYLRGKWHIMPGNGKAVGNYVYIDDVIKGHYRALIAGIPGEQYILGGENLSFGQIVRNLNRETGRSHLLISLPQPVLMGFVSLVVLLARIRGSDPVITPEWISHYLSDTIFSVRKAENELDYTVTPFAEALKKTVKWLQLNKTYEKR
jgi:nucleoside-diphosphate-sugar epimerase